MDEGKGKVIVWDKKKILEEYDSVFDAVSALRANWEPEHYNFFIEEGEDDEKIEEE